MHTLCPFGDWPRDSPGSPFCPWNIKIDITVFKHTFRDTSFPAGTIYDLSKLGLESVHIFCIATVFHFTRSRWALTLDLCYKRVMSLSCLLVSLAVVLYLYKRAVHLYPTVTPFTTSQHEVMRSDRAHSSPFSGSGNPVSAFWARIQGPVAPVDELTSDLSECSQCFSWKNTVDHFIC